MLSEDRIRDAFKSYGGIRECDGAVGGKIEGWVMVSMDNMDKANSAIKGLRDARNPIGIFFITLYNGGGVYYTFGVGTYAHQFCNRHCMVAYFH